MFPGSVAGLPAEVATMPELLRQAGYSAHMVGKWHLGYSQWSQTPVGRGFQSHVGGFMWDLESYTKVGLHCSLTDIKILFHRPFYVY